MKRITGILLTAIILIGFTANAKPYEISGSTNLGPDVLVYLMKVTDTKLEFKDSVRTTKKGDFKMTGETDDVSRIFYITFENQNPPGIPVILESGAQIKMDVEKGDFIHYTIDGGRYNTHMHKLHELYIKHDETMTAFNAGVSQLNAEAMTDVKRKEISDKYNELILTRSNEIEAFIQNEPASPATYFAVKFLFQRPEPKLVLMGSEKMNNEIPESPYSVQLKKEADVLGPTVEGQIAPDIKLPSPEGDSVSLYSLRGKVVLIDFWASWCGPCRRENPHVVQIYNRYKDKGFEIYGVSLDKNMKQWQDAIAKDGLTWYHVSDLKGWSNSAARLYGVRSIPQTYLLDQEGRIIASGLRSAELEQILSNLFD